MLENNGWDPDRHPQIPGTEQVWLGPPETHSLRGVTLPLSMSKGSVLWDRPSLGLSSGNAGLSGKILLSAPAHTSPAHVRGRELSRLRRDPHPRLPSEPGCVSG